MNTNDHQTYDLYVDKYGVRNRSQELPSFHTCLQKYILLFITDGTGHITFPSHTFTLEKGQALLIFPDQEHYNISSDSNAPLTFMWIVFSGSQSSSLLEHTSFSVQYPVCGLHVPLEHIEQIFLDLLNVTGSSLSSEIQKTGYLYRLLSLLTASHHVSQSKGTSHAYPSRTYAIYAKEYIKNNYSHTNIIDIASHIGIDRSYLHHVFKKYFHLSPQEYLITCRLEEAEILLKETDLSIQQIAHEVGYEDPLQFSKIFKKYYGQSPKCYRNTQSEE